MIMTVMMMMTTATMIDHNDEDVDDEDEDEDSDYDDDDDDHDDDDGHNCDGHCGSYCQRPGGICAMSYALLLLLVFERGWCSLPFGA